MGAGVPSREVAAVGGGAEEADIAGDIEDDQQVILQTRAPGDLDEAYQDLLQDGLIVRYDSYVKKKKDRQMRKKMDSKVVLQNSITEQPSESHFRRKHLKCLQREMSFLAQPADLYADVMGAREQVIFRMAVAFQRILAYEKKNGKSYQSSTDEKARCIEHFLKNIPTAFGEEEEEESKSKSDGTTKSKDKMESSDGKTPTDKGNAEEKDDSKNVKESKDEREVKEATSARENTTSQDTAEEKTVTTDEVSTGSQVDAGEKDAKTVEKPSEIKENKQKGKNANVPEPIYSMDSKFIEEMVQFADTLPEIFGSTGLLARPRDTANSSRVSKANLGEVLNSLQSVGNRLQGSARLRFESNIRDIFSLARQGGVESLGDGLSEVIDLIDRDNVDLDQILSGGFPFLNPGMRQSRGGRGGGGRGGRGGGRIGQRTQRGGTPSREVRQVELQRALEAAAQSLGISSERTSLVSTNTSASTPVTSLVHGTPASSSAAASPNSSAAAAVEDSKAGSIENESKTSLDSKLSPEPTGETIAESGESQSGSAAGEDAVESEAEAKSEGKSGDESNPGGGAESEAKGDHHPPRSEAGEGGTTSSRGNAESATTTTASSSTGVSASSSAPTTNTEQPSDAKEVKESKDDASSNSSSSSSSSSSSNQAANEESKAQQTSNASGGSQPSATPQSSSGGRAAAAEALSYAAAVAARGGGGGGGSTSSSSRGGPRDASSSPPGWLNHLVSSMPSSSRSSNSRRGGDSKDSKETKTFKQDAHDWDFRSEKLLMRLMERCTKDAKDSLRVVLESKGSKVKMPKAFIQLHPCADLLWFLQMDLFKKCVGRKEATHPEVQTLIRYLKELLGAITELLQIAAPFLQKKKTDAKNDDKEEETKKIKESGGNEEKGAEKDDSSQSLGVASVSKKAQKNSPSVDKSSAVHGILYDSLAGDIGQMAVVVIASSVLHPVYGTHLSEALVDSVMALLGVLDKISTSSNTTPEAKFERELTSRFDAASKLHANPVMIETPHTYFAPEPDKVVTIPGATHLSLEFDPRCSTERGRDFLTITTPSGESVCDELHGRPDTWPDMPILVPGDTAIFRFRPDTPNNYFGYRCLVTGLYLGPEDDDKVDDDKKGETKKKHGVTTKTPVPSRVERGVSSTITNAPSKSTNTNSNAESEKRKENPDEKPQEKIVKEEKKGTLTFVEPPKGWVIELERASACALGRCLRALSIGPSVSPEEKKAHDWLASPLFAGGAEGIEEKLDVGSSPNSDELSLEDLVEDRKGSSAAKLYAHMRMLLPKKPHEMMGGTAVKKTVRRFIAIVLKHLGLLPVAEDYLHELQEDSSSTTSTSSSSKSKVVMAVDPVQALMREKLRQVWECAQEFHLIISRDFRQNQMEFYAREEKMKETKEQWDEKELEKAKAKLTWEGFCKSINDRCLLLLSQRPFFEASNSARALLMTPPRLTRVSSAYKPASGSSNVHNSLTSLYSAFDVVHSSSIDDKGEAPTVDMQQEAFNQLTDLVIQFLSAPNPVSKFKKMMEVHGCRARQRIKAIHTLRGALSSIKLESCKISILSSWSTPFRQYSAYPRSEVEKLAPRGSHYLRNIESSGPKLITAVHDEVTGLYRELSCSIRDNDVSEQMKALAIDSWAIDLLPHDHTFLLKTGILGVLEKVAGAEAKNGATSPSSTQPKNLLLARMAAKALRVLHVNALDCSPTLGTGATQNTLNKLQVHVLNRTLVDLQEGLRDLDVLREKLSDVRITNVRLGHDFCVKPKSLEEKLLSDVLKQSLGNSGVAHSSSSESLNSTDRKGARNVQRYMDKEQQSFDALAMMCSTLGGFATQGAAAFLSKKPVLECFIKILSRGTLRMQRVVFRVFRVLLPKIGPSLIDGLCEKVGWGSQAEIAQVKKAGRFTRTLFMIVGNALITQKPAGLINQSPFEYRNGQSVLAHASDALALLRILGVVVPTTPSSSASEDAQDNGEDTKTKEEEDEKEEERLAAERSVSSLEWEAQVRALIAYGFRQLPKLINKSQGGMNADHLRQNPCDLPYAMAAFSIIGGHSPQLTIGGRVEIVRSSSSGDDEGAMRETGDLVYLDRSSNICRVRFDHTPARVVECEISKLRAIDPVEFDPKALFTTTTLTKDFISIFQLFTQVLNEDATEQVKRKEEEEKAKKVQESERKEKEAKRIQREKEAASATWDCQICTFINQPSAKSCAMCGTPRPAALPNLNTDDLNDDNGQEEGESKATEKEASEDALLYRQLRSVALESLCSLMKSEEVSKLLIGSSSMLPALLRLATQPTTLDSYKSVPQLHAEHDRLQELLLQARDSVIDYLRVFKRKAKGITLDCSPFKGLQVQLPNALDAASSRAMTFVGDDDLTTATFNATKLMGTMRSNHAIPNSLLAYYFEITIEDEGVSPELASGAAGTDKSKEIEKKKSNGSWGIAFGLFRAGMQMDGVPGSYNSYAFNSTGELISTISRVPVRKEFGEPFGSGDVLGCVWEIRSKRVYFTKNGSVIKSKDGSETAFTNVDGFFHPIVWCQNAGARVSVNFGQSKWRFNFKQTLPAHYLQQLADAEKKGDKMNWKASEAEIRRKTMAEELVVMMGIFPTELCEVALERCQDDMEHAANWLIENGRRELEIMTNNAIRASEMMHESKQMEAAGVIQDRNRGAGEDDSDDEDLAEWLVGNGNVSSDPSSQRRAAAASFLDDEIEQDVPVGVERNEIRRNGDAEAREHGGQQNQHVASQANEDSVDIVYDNLKIEDVHPGQMVTVNPLALSIIGENFLTHGPQREHIRAVAGRSGLVANVEVNCKAVQLLFSNLDQGSQHCLWLPLNVLLRASGQWQDPCPQQYSGESWGKLGHKFLDCEQALSVRKVRSAVVGLVAQKWPKNIPFGLKQLGGAEAVMCILQLTAAEVLSTVLDDKINSSALDSSVPLLDAFREKILRIVENEWEAVKSRPESSLPELHHHPETLHKTISSGEKFEHKRDYLSKSSCPLIQTLLEECIVHFAQAVDHPPPVLVYKSKHPYASHDEVREEVHIPGANKLVVTFDSRCHLGNDILTRLSFYRDPDYQDLISQHNGRGAARYPTLVVPGDRLFFKFTSQNNNGLWGYKFKVKPLEYRLDDQQALNSHNFELGRWLFELFLTQMPQEITERYIVELYDAITLYVIHARPSTKIKGVKLLIQFLLHVHRIPALRLSLLLGRMAKVPDLKKLKPLTQEMDAVMGSLDVNRTIHSQTLQALMELLATADLVQKDFTIGKRRRHHLDTTSSSRDSKEEKEEKDSKEEDNKNTRAGTTAVAVAAPHTCKIDFGQKNMADIRNYGRRRLVILEAKYSSGATSAASSSSSKNSSSSLDITTSLQAYLNRCGGADLVLPVSFKLLSELKPFGVDPDPSCDKKKLRILYRIEREEYVPGKGAVMNVVKDKLERTLVFRMGTKTQPAVGDGELTHHTISSSPSMFEQVVRISRFTLQAQVAAPEISSSSATVTTDSKNKNNLKAAASSSSSSDGDVKKSSSAGSPRGVATTSTTSSPFGKGNIVATDELLIEAVRLWSLEGSYTQLVPPTGDGKELQPKTELGFANPGHFSNQFTASMWIFLKKEPSKKSTAAPRAILHRGYHITTGDPSPQKFAFRRVKHDTSRMLFMILMDARDNYIQVHCDASSHGAAHIIKSKKQVPVRKWTHVAVVCRGHAIEIFIDGKIDFKGNLQRPMAGNVDPIILGRPTPGFRAAGLPPSRPGAPTNAATPEAQMQSVEAVVKDVRWYVRDLSEKGVKAIMEDCKPNNRKRSSQKNFTLQSPSSLGGDFKSPNMINEAHLDAIDALCTGRRVAIESADSSSSSNNNSSNAGGDVNPSIWKHWHQWTPRMDMQLMRLFTEIAEHRQKAMGIFKRGALPSLINLPARMVEIPDKLLRPYPLLRGIPRECLRMRFLFIQILNVRILSVLPMVDFSQALSPWSLAHRLSALSHLIFLEIKNIAWTHILQQTATGRGHYVNINLPRAKKAQERGDTSGRKSVFFQLYLQLHFVKPSLLRVDGGSRPWVVSYAGFGGQDAGGLFRDSVSTLCTELQSKWVPLFIPVPNSRDGGVGDNQEKWLPNPSSRSALHISNYAFVGKLMGIAVRGSHMLNLDLPSLVWKPLVGDTVTMSDVKAVDVIAHGRIESLAKALVSANAAATSGSINKESYMDLVPNKFIMIGYDGKEVELKEDGKNIDNTWETREEYLSLLKQAKLAEVRPQAQAIRKGLGTIVPIQLLPLFTWQELEMMVCGKREIDIDYLRANTRYRAPVKGTDPHVKMLWEVLEDFNHEERRLFLRFVWGQSRLPYNPAVVAVAVVGIVAETAHFTTLR